ncbi:MAG: hypothetical protein FJ147_25990 [Deltaproteobacteria bacterium]|nr:hypothetical protein [Deltaproteobacteria bacterium]
MSDVQLQQLVEIEPPTNPFPGLRPFEFHENHLFFGREGQSEQLISKLGTAHFLAVVGTSGSGKSSLVRAGLLPALFGGLMGTSGSRWRVAIMRPGNDPLSNLARALDAPDVFGTVGAPPSLERQVMTETLLRRGSLGLVELTRQAKLATGENLLVLVDQFEELFRVEQSTASQETENEKAAFVKLLLEAKAQRDVPIYVVLTMRSDYLGDCAQFWDLPEAINDSQYLIPRLTRDQRREVITGPVAVGEATITPRLVNRILNDVGDDPDQLPLLQHALMRTWEQWQAEQQPHASLDLRHYEAIGGLGRALSYHADEAYNELSPAQQKLAEHMFKCLTEKGTDNREVRRPQTVRELCEVIEADEQDVIAVINVFRQPGRSFLMPPAEIELTADSLIDISHESLIRNWQKLKTWVEEEAQSAAIYKRLAQDADLHRQGKSALLRDPGLQFALDWQVKNKPNNAWAQRYHKEFSTTVEFLQQSKKARQRKLWQTRILISFLGVAFLFASGLAWYIDQLRSEALEQKTKAEGREKEAIEQRLRAETKEKEADEQRFLAETREKEAQRQRQIAIVQSQKAEEQKTIAEDQRRQTLVQKKTGRDTT